MKKKIQSHILEKIIGILMLVFAGSAVYIFVKSVQLGLLVQDIAIMEMLIILIMAVLAQTVILIRIYEMHL